MLFFKAIFFIFIACSLSKISGQSIKSQLVPVTNKPRDIHRLFNTRTSTASQCIYVCIGNKKCMAIFYDNPRSMCLGYKVHIDEEPLSGDVKGWKIVYAGKIALSIKLILLSIIF